MFGGRTFDEINENNTTHKAMDYDRYFGEMDLTDEQKEERKAMAKRLENEFFFVLALVYAMAEQGEVDWDYTRQQFVDGYMNALAAGMASNASLLSYIQNFAADVTTSTMDGVDDPYTYTGDRAMFMAENEANTAWNNQDFEDAIANGYTEKRWKAIIDKKTRKTHKEADGQVVPIDEPFEVGGCLMNFPKDDSLGAGPEEIVNCRCSAEYL